jgi:predicted MFS family arabinose efflux permease
MRVTPNTSPVSAIAAIVLGIGGPLIFVTIPFFVAFVKDGRGFTSSEVSLLSSADMMGMFISSVYAAVWIPDGDWRRRSLAAVALLIAATVASMYAMSFIVFGLCRIVAGMGAGTLMAVGLAAMAEKHQPERWFGWFASSQAVLGAVAAWVIPRWVEPYGLTGYLVSLVLVYILLLPCASLISTGPRSVADQTASHDHAPSNAMASLSLLGAFVFSLGIYAAWSHLELLGRRSAISSATIGNAISTAYLLGIVASLVATAVAGRVSRRLLVIIITLCQAAGLYLLLTEATNTTFFTAVLLLGWAWYFSTPFQLSITAAFDRSGRFIVLFISAIKLSYVASGALLSVLLAQDDDLRRVLALSAASAAGSFALYVALARRAPAPYVRIETE